jgi:bifunctional UDP-N-acetylglucosamine pyrophosphorylase/glucosamine-1-phosphate N-acetyltransferase
MRSRTPKVLHTIAGRPMIDLVLDAVLEAGVERPIVVVNPDQPEVAEHVAGRADVVFQGNPRGTGDALGRVPQERLRGHDVLVVNGDMPLLQTGDLLQVLNSHRGGATIATAKDRGYADGRVVRRPDGSFERIVEMKDASAEERRIDEINTGVYVFDGDQLEPALAAVQPSAATGEVYLTTAVGHFRPVNAVQLLIGDDTRGVNDRMELWIASNEMYIRKHQELFAAGVTLLDTSSIFVDLDVEVGEDTVIEPFTILRGVTKIGRGCVIGPYAHLTDTVLGENCRVEHSRLDGCRLGDDTDCGPFSRVRPGSDIAAGVHVGSFAEINRTSIGDGTRVPHFSYLGDAVIGRNVNIAAGSVTANYDGVAKHRTVIEDDVFLGVDTMLRAPVKLGKGSRTGAGAVVLDDVQPGETVIGVPARPIRKERKARA